MNGEKVLTLELLRVTTDLGFLIVVGLVLTWNEVIDKYFCQDIIK